MLNINGLKKFAYFFSEYTDNYVLIGGSACVVIFDEIGEDFRATKDLDIVLIIENIDSAFGNKLWEFIKDAGYIVESSEPPKQFYRFSKPKSGEYPKMIELFSRAQNPPILFDAHLQSIHISDNVSSLSSILLNDDYYSFMLKGKRIIDGLSVLDEKYLIPFKAKAWCELIDRKIAREKGQSKHIKKHYRDICRLVSLLPQNTSVELSGMVKQDMTRFVEDILTSEFVSSDIDKIQLHNALKNIYL